MRSVALPALLAATLAYSMSPADDQPVFKPTEIKGHFIEQFTEGWEDRWTPSEATKKTPVGSETFSYVGKWSVEGASTSVIEGDHGLVAKSTASHHAISAPFDKPIDTWDQPLVVQYEVKYQKGGNCGGGYVKLLEDGFQSSGKEFDDKTPWVIMFGPDLTCPGTKLHFIFRHKNPKTGEYEEKHLTAPPKPSIDKTTNLYTLFVHPNNTYDVSVNGESVNRGNLLENFTPSVNPPAEIDDPEDKKPADWVDIKRIADPDATKPDDWDEDEPYEILDEDAEKPEGWLDDEPLTVPDPDAEKPEEWDDEEDGDWIAPTVPNLKCDEAPGCGEWKRPYKPNPLYRGKWFAPLVDNPAYKGEWAPRQISNPDYFEDSTPAKSLKKIGGVGIELWTMTEDILFDNLYIGRSVDDAKAFAAETFDIKHSLEKAADQAAISEDEEDERYEFTFAENPVEFLRNKAFKFIAIARVDPVAAFKTHPETGVALAGALLTFCGMLGALFGLVGSQQRTVTKPSKKTDAPTPDDKDVKEKAPVAPAGEKKAEDTPLKKRK